jgi:amidase
VSTPVHYQTITQLAPRLQSGDLLSSDLTRQILDRIDQLDGDLKAYATIMADQAIAAADGADSEITSGFYRGPLHGIPIAVKDLCFTRGITTMGGSHALSDHVPRFNGTVVTRLEAAGAILLGKLNLTEGAMGGYNPKFEIPKNPWNPERWAGASSSGSGAATAAGLCFGSLGSDTGGSIRFPAAACGTVGLKPTWGRVSRYGVLALADSLDHVGPLTRSVADAGIMLQAIAGHDENDPTSLVEPVPNMLEGIDRGIEDIRIGFDKHYATHDINPEMASAVCTAVDILANQGAEIVEVRLPDMDPYVAAWGTLCSAEAVAAHRTTYPSRRDDYGPYFRGWLDKGAAVSGADYAEANTLRLESNGHLRTAFQNIDVLVCPSMSAPPHPVTPEEMYGPLPDARAPRFQRFTAPFDYNGASTLSLPCGMTADNLPLSLQLVGHHLSEQLLCRVGHTFENATEWHILHPPV